MVCVAVLANSRRDGRGEPVKNQVIDDILRKAEVAKERQKKEQAQSKLTTPEDPATLDPVKCFPKVFYSCNLILFRYLKN